MKPGPRYAVVAAAMLLAACSPGERQSSAQDMMSADMPMMGEAPNATSSDGMMGMMGEGVMEDMGSIRSLLADHEKVERQVEDIPNGVRTVTTSDDPKVAALIRRHVRQMDARYDRDQPIRIMDPVFRELFRNRDRASLKYEDIPGGIRVTHTSDDPNVVLLIRQHARHFVSEAAEEGMARAMRPTPLPQGYGPMPR